MRRAARAIAKLWRSWPSDAIAADRASRVYAAANRIVRIDHRGVFDIDGPLTLPTTPQGVPVLAWWAATPDELSAGDQAGVVELVVTPENQVAASATPLWVEVETVPDVARSISRIEAAADAGEVAGVVPRSQPEAMSLADTLRTLIPALQDADLVDASHGHTLRDRLSLPDAELDVADAGPAFPAPQPASAP